MPSHVTFIPNPKWDEELAVMLEPHFDRLGEKVADEAKALAPVATGRLRNSIRHQIVRGEHGLPVVLVAATVDYALYQEFGTRYDQPHPFLRPALRDVIR